MNGLLVDNGGGRSTIAHELKVRLIRCTSPKGKKLNDACSVSSECQSTNEFLQCDQGFCRCLPPYVLSLKDVCTAKNGIARQLMIYSSCFMILSFIVGGLILWHVGVGSGEGATSSSSRSCLLRSRKDSEGRSHQRIRFRMSASPRNTSPQHTRLWRLEDRQKTTLQTNSVASDHLVTACKSEVPPYMYERNFVSCYQFSRYPPDAQGEEPSGQRLNASSEDSVVLGNRGFMTADSCCRLLREELLHERRSSRFATWVHTGAQSKRRDVLGRDNAVDPGTRAFSEWDNEYPEASGPTDIGCQSSSSRSSPETQKNHRVNKLGWPSDSVRTKRSAFTKGNSAQPSVETALRYATGHTRATAVTSTGDVTVSKHSTASECPNLQGCQQLVAHGASPEASVEDETAAEVGETAFADSATSTVMVKVKSSKPQGDTCEGSPMATRLRQHSDRHAEVTGKVQELSTDGEMTHMNESLAALCVIGSKVPCTTTEDSAAQPTVDTALALATRERPRGLLSMPNARIASDRYSEVRSRVMETLQLDLTDAFMYSTPVVDRLRSVDSRRDYLSTKSMRLRSDEQWPDFPTLLGYLSSASRCVRLSYMSQKTVQNEDENKAEETSKFGEP
ncbi:uncharacterized protein LOC135400508 [Ornithodoros turicata]|uniref:uncharacterized protein LOC135400508 n=1 Tax=Ornithodoros turicata TaxID=34597 RepID=UPI00313A1327